MYNDPSFGDFQSGENALYIKPVLQPWDESTIMWYNQPEVLKDTSQYKFIYVPKSKYKTQNYKIDITSLMKYWVEDQHPNYGMQIRLVKESIYADAFFASSEDSNAALRPKLKVYYNVAQYRFITMHLESAAYTNSLLMKFLK